MKRYLSFLNLLASFIVLIFFSSCSKEKLTTSSVGPVDTTAVSSPPPTTFVVNATNWTKMSEGNYKCTFYGLNGYGSTIAGNVKVYAIIQNMEIIISTGSIPFMNGQLSAGHDSHIVWASFQTTSENQALPFSSLKLKIVFE